MASPWLSWANKAEREGEDSSLLPSFSKSGGGPGGGGGGGGGGRPGPEERTENTDAVGATGPCGRQMMGAWLRLKVWLGVTTLQPSMASLYEGPWIRLGSGLEAYSVLGGPCICRNPTTRSSANVHSPKFMSKALDKNETSTDYKIVRKSGSKDKKINFFFCGQWKPQPLKRKRERERVIRHF